MVLLAPFAGPIQMLLTAAWVWEERADRDRNRFSKCLHVKRWNTSRNFRRKCFKKLYIQGLRKEIPFSLTKITRKFSSPWFTVSDILLHSHYVASLSLLYCIFFFPGREKLTEENHAKPENVEYPRPSSTKPRNFPARNEFISNRPVLWAAAHNWRGRRSISFHVFAQLSVYSHLFKVFSIS